MSLDAFQCSAHPHLHTTRGAVLKVVFRTVWLFKYKNALQALIVIFYNNFL